jgi:hypothetical protein
METELLTFLWQFALGFGAATLLWKRPRKPLPPAEDRDSGLARYQAFKDSKR